MKTRVIPTFALVASVLSLVSKPPVDWKRVGEDWSHSFTKEGANHLKDERITGDRQLYGDDVLLERVTVERNLTCYGIAELNQSHVYGVTTMFGPLKAFESTFKDVDVRCYDDSVKLIDCKIEKLTINGHLNAQDCDIRRMTTFASDTVLTNSTIQDILVMTDEKSIVELNNTLVEGSITFDSKGGIVIAKGTSEVRGSIIGGTLRKE